MSKLLLCWVVLRRTPRTRSVCARPYRARTRSFGEDCEPSACSKVWSAATPAADAFANDYFNRSIREVLDVQAYLQGC